MIVMLFFLLFSALKSQPLGLLYLFKKSIGHGALFKALSLYFIGSFVNFHALKLIGDQPLLLLHSFGPI